jgi:pimeloyl-ACP methyl ester carboxylesterase
LKKDLILLHGALGSSRQFDALKSILVETYNVHVLNFNGHGAADIGKFYIDGFADDLADYIEKNELDKPFVFGYSMGGYVSLYLESVKPGTIGKLVTLGTKFDWSEETSQKEVKFLDPEMIKTKVPKYAEFLNGLHGERWKEVLKNTADLMLRLGSDPLLTHDKLSSLDLDAVITVGESDNMVTREETKNVADQISNSVFLTHPEVQHPLEKVDKQWLAKFLTSQFN